ncbi:proline-rich receptor-like protein kinase PERK2 [Iris pallida]|uniref:Proline-rich receptor-like protein kinase PERK2 n=1 Tax=Iris pallida TaxID=29817 RepID=A0AAX6DJ09_IRIPA|nr:proline-rich receptor-like protein kinase PERK2 [Iris pallida]KAJ6812834.1 proline-rich receptor-like protein kinase PERK2 [Iris pallida]
MDFGYYIKYLDFGRRPYRSMGPNEIGFVRTLRH